MRGKALYWRPLHLNMWRDENCACIDIITPYFTRVSPQPYSGFLSYNMVCYGFVRWITNTMSKAAWTVFETTGEFLGTFSLSCLTDEWLNANILNFGTFINVSPIISWRSCFRAVPVRARAWPSRVRAVPVPKKLGTWRPLLLLLVV